MAKSMDGLYAGARHRSLAVAAAFLHGCSGASPSSLCGGGSCSADGSTTSGADSSASPPGSSPDGSSADGVPPSDGLDAWVPSHDGAASDSALDSPGTSPDAATDDPCPTVSPSLGAGHVINCSSTCGARSDLCSMGLTCPSNGYSVSASELPLVVRTPDHPAVTESCAACGGSAFALVFNVLASAGVKVTVGEPWSIVDDSACKSSCLLVVEPTLIKIATTDTAAPARNVVFEAAGAGDGGCL